MKIGNLIRSLNTGVLALLAFGGMLLYMCAADLVVSFKPAVSFEELLEEGKELKPGSHVEGNVVYALDYFASESNLYQAQRRLPQRQPQIRELLYDTGCDGVFCAKVPPGGR